MAHLILGILHLSDNTLYGLKKAFEGTIALFYSSSLGALKRALDNLLAAEHIALAHVEAGPRGRKTYTLTASGRAEFVRWMRSPIRGTDIETVALVRTYLLGILPADDRVAVLDTVVDAMSAHVDRLVELQDRLADIEVAHDLDDVLHHQLATLRYGIESGTHTRDWFTDHRDRVRAGLHQGAP